MKPIIKQNHFKYYKSMNKIGRISRNIFISMEMSEFVTINQHENDEYICVNNEDNDRFTFKVVDWCDIEK